MKKYDYLVIGTGAGMLLTRALASYGKKCAIVEKSRFGGTCLTKGCIPSKVLVYPADLIRDAQAAHRVGLEFEPPKIDWDKITRRVWEQIDISERVEKSLDRAENIDVYKGVAEFVDNNTVRVLHKDGTYSEDIKSKEFIIACGARSFVPPIPNIEETGYLVSETFFGDKYPDKLWDSLIIVGGGAIGAEFAHMFSSFGTKVTIVEMRSSILSTEDNEVSAFVQKNFAANGIDVLTDSKIINSGKRDGNKYLTLENTKTGEVTEVLAQEILISSGVRPNTDLIKIENTDVECDEKGYIKTDEYLHTNVKHIHAIGDVNGKYLFRHTANYEADVFMRNLIYKASGRQLVKACYNTVPWAIFTYPQVGHVGMTEEEAKASGQKYWVGKNYYSAVAAGNAMGISRGSEDDGFVKVIVGEHKKILGAHVVGHYASVLVQSFVYLMNAGREHLHHGFADEADCPLGSYAPIEESMVIHPSANELTAWVLDNIEYD